MEQYCSHSLFSYLLSLGKIAVPKYIIKIDRVMDQRVKIKHIQLERQKDVIERFLSKNNSAVYHATYTHIKSL